MFNRASAETSSPTRGRVWREPAAQGGAMISRVGRIALFRCATASIAIIIRSRSITGGPGAAFWVAGRNTPQKAVWRARIVLMWADGAGITKIVQTTGKTKRTAYRWRDHYVERGIEGLRRDASRPGRKKPLGAATIERVVDMTLHEKPPAGTHWSARKLARATGLSHTSVQCIWVAHGLKPHLTKTFKLSNDPQFTEKVQDIVGLYLDPPDKALVLCIDEKSQIQALDRTQPGLPMKKGRAGTMTHDYNVMARRPCSPRSTSPAAKLSANACIGTGIRSSCAFYAP
jgi:transposase